MEAEVLGAGASTEAVSTPDTFRVGPFDDPDRYEIGEPVEAGAEGILYRGRVVTPTSRLSLSVAVKALQPAYSSRIDQWAARWRDQVELLRSLQIPGLVGVREGFVGPLPHLEGAPVAGRNLYLVMNWVEGEALDHWALHHRGIDVRNALKLLLPVAVAVDTMHGGQLTGSVPVVHRDIKPANILIGQNGSVLVDFGLTKGLSIGHPVGRAGTPGYIAPEVVAGGGYTPAADRYAFGATVFFLLTGRHPPTSPKPQELRQLLEKSPLGGASQGTTIPPELVDRVVTMLDPDPLRRPGALANWIAQLRQSSLDDEVLTVRLAPPAPARPAGARRPGHTASDNSASAATGGPSGGSSTAAGPPGGLGTGDGLARGAQVESAPTDGRISLTGPGDTQGLGRRARSEPSTTFPGALGPAGIAGGVGASAPWLGEGRATMPSNEAASASSPGGSTGLVLSGQWTGNSLQESLSPANANPSGIHQPPAGSAGVELAAVPGHRRGGAHAATRRQPQHARHQRAVASKLALVLVLAVVLPAVAADTGAFAHPAKRPPAALGPVAPAGVRPSPGSKQSVVTDPSGFPAITVRPDVPAGLSTTVPSVTTTTTCFESFTQACGELKWVPPVLNQSLSFQVTFTPQNPTPGQTVTFTVAVTDPDDSPIELVGAFYGDEGASTVGSSTANGPSGCKTPYGIWTPPAPSLSGHIEQQMTHAYAGPGVYPVHFVAASGHTPQVCGMPDPYASTGQSSTLTVNVSTPPPPPTTTSTTSTTLPPPPPPTTTTTTTVVTPTT
ncbi:MAG: protein kinase domain-containing protein [Acidimicrobiales bacterium]